MPTTQFEEALADAEREEKLREIDAEIGRHGVKHVYLQYTSVPGRIMGKVIPARHFERIAQAGLAWTYLSAGGFASTADGELIGPSGAAATEGLLLPDLDTFQVLPWDTDMARVFCDHFHRPDDETRPGAFALGDCRANLKCLYRDFQDAHGYQVMTGCEPEMSWFPDRSSISANISTLPGHISTAYHIGHIENISEILKKVTSYGQAMGLDMIQADYEDPGQIEMNFSFGTLLETADRLSTFRQICMQVAKEHGVLATFMPKPVTGIMANGCHHHISLWENDRPAFVDPGQSTINDIGRWAVGGILAHARGMSALCAPTVNSYARYWDAGLFAPTVPVWGYDNRLCTIRVLGSRVEYRAPDASCNPYLTHAALLSALRDGIENRIEPGDPLEVGEEIGAERQDRFPALPKTLGEAIEALEDDPVIRGALPEDIFRTFVDIKRDEWQRSCAAVTDWALDMYLSYLP